MNNTKAQTKYCAKHINLFHLEIINSLDIWHLVLQFQTVPKIVFRGLYIPILTLHSGQECWMSWISSTINGKKANGKKPKRSRAAPVKTVFLMLLTFSSFVRIFAPQFGQRNSIEYAGTSWEFNLINLLNFSSYRNGQQRTILFNFTKKN